MPAIEAAPPRMSSSKPLLHLLRDGGVADVLHCSAYDFVAALAHHAQGLAVGLDDGAAHVHQHDGVAGLVHEGAIPLHRGAQLLAGVVQAREAARVGQGQVEGAGKRDCEVEVVVALLGKGEGADFEEARLSP